MQGLSFSFMEILSFIGLTQCVYLVVHILFHSRLRWETIIPLIYFTVLALAFFTDALKGNIPEIKDNVFFIEWFAWFLGPPLSYLLIVQMSRADKFPSPKDFGILILLPLSMAIAFSFLDTSDECNFKNACEDLRGLLNVFGLMSGTISLLLIFSRAELFRIIRKQRNGSERYWLVLSLIILNVLFLGTVFANIAGTLPQDISLTLIRNVLGLGFVYLVSTSLLRIFPKESSKERGTRDIEELSNEEKQLAKKIEKLLDLDKVYQEPTYSRKDLANECNASEITISKVINTYFEKSFPQIMNERRVEDAKRLLVDTDAAIKTVGEEVGFNSLPSFNRVFKDMVGISPGEYRKNHLSI